MLTWIKIIISGGLVILSYVLAYSFSDLGVFFGWSSALGAVCICIYLPESILRGGAG